MSVQSNKTVNYTFRGRNSDDDKRDAEAAERERLRDEGKPVVSIGDGATAARLSNTRLA